jgi:hypothetical protein
MISRLISRQLRILMPLALAAGMAFVYPAHVIVDHSGLFDKQTHPHQNDDNQKDDSKSEDDFCALCLTLGSMEASDCQYFVSEGSEIENYVLKQRIPGNSPAIGKPARAPPGSYDFSFYTFIHF